MALVVFRSKAAGELFYFPADAQRLLEIAGKELGPRGIFTTDQIPEAIDRLEAAIAQEDASRRARESAEVDAEEENTAAAKRVSLAQRAFPLLDMLRAALKKKVDVTWGV
jgi:hypothetical protein